MVLHKAKIVITLLSVFCLSYCQGQLPAFPGAKGFGKFANGGRGGDVLFVTNLNDTGPGSLREACLASGSRTIVFRIGGTITLNSTIEIVNPNITIAGQTAPGGGICLRLNPESNNDVQATMAILADHVIIRGMRFRAGPNTVQSNSQIHDCLDIWDGENIIIDHCSFTWGEDENVAIWSSIPGEHPQKITIQKSIIGQALRQSESANEIQGYGMLVGGTIGATEVSIIDNLFIHNPQRNPLLKSEQPSVFEIYNNVIYNYGFLGTDFSDDVQVNLMSNYYKPGFNSSTNRYEVLIRDDASLYVEGNIGVHRPNMSLPEWDIVGFNGTIPPGGYSESPAPLMFQSNTPFAPLPNDIVSADEAFNTMLTSMDVGANFKLNDNGEFTFNLDELDVELIQDLINNTGTYIFDTAIGNTIQYPILDRGVAALDSDADGMPDVWEQSCQLNVNDPSDKNVIADNGYTNLENYLNGVSCSKASNANIYAAENFIQVNPSPSDGIFNLEGELSNYTIDILNSTGTVIQNIDSSENVISIDIGDLPNGIYILRLFHNSNDRLHLEKLIKY